MLKTNINLFFEGVLLGLKRFDGGNSTSEEMHLIAIEITEKYFYHYPIYQNELEKWKNEQSNSTKFIVYWSANDNWRGWQEVESHASEVDIEQFKNMIVQSFPLVIKDKIQITKITQI